MTESGNYEQLEQFFEVLVIVNAVEDASLCSVRESCRIESIWQSMTRVALR